MLLPPCEPKRLFTRAQLACEVRRRFEPRVRAARAAMEACDSMAAWARGIAARPWPPGALVADSDSDEEAGVAALGNRRRRQLLPWRRGGGGNINRSAFVCIVGQIDTGSSSRIVPSDFYPRPSSVIYYFCGQARRFQQDCSQCSGG